MSLKSIMIESCNNFNRFCEFLKPLGDLFIRYWVAKAFFMSGLIKIHSWSTTLMLFEFEYHVPWLSPEIAATTSAFIELFMSALLLLGLGGRIPAFFLFVFNIIAVYSYSFLWTPAGYVGLKDHICWGLLLLVLVLHGPGKISLDRLFVWVYKNHRAKTSSEPI